MLNIDRTALVPFSGVWSFRIFLCIAIGFATTTCLKPPGTPSSTNEDERAAKCIEPQAKPTVMHERSDIEWPTASCRAKARDLVSKMTLEEKIGQMVQPDRSHLQNDDDVATMGVGSVLSGGDTDPPTNSPTDWVNMVGSLRATSLKSRLQIPILFGIDAVHGHSNVSSAVVFPHNIGLGCTKNPDLLERIGKVTAEEVAATGIDWTFAPVFAAARDERWGRTYEAFGETPELATSLGTAFIRGLQGERLGQGQTSVLGCAKHFAGDGGTQFGVDQGNTEITEEALLELHVQQYRDAVNSGVGSVMASFSSVNSVKMHCHGSLLTDTLKTEMGFNGFIVSDWEAVEKIPGDYKEQVRHAINAGIDMVMAPKSYRAFINTLKKLVPDEVPMERIDDAVGRILSIKCEMGLLGPNQLSSSSGHQTPTDETLFEKLGGTEHREVARDAVRQSLVLLKNEKNVLPLKKNLSRIHVAGKSANDLGNQCGGWTISWQGSSGAITQGTTILSAIRQAVTSSHGDSEITYSLNGSDAKGADVGIAVIGEKPYAEGAGDRKDLTLDEEDIEVVRRLREAGVPVVVILISGRPMILGDTLDNSDAFIAAWLPGTEGSGVADVLFGDFAPTGKLSHSWPKSMDQIPINVGDQAYYPLFPYGFGLTY